MVGDLSFFETRASVSTEFLIYRQRMDAQLSNVQSSMINLFTEINTLRAAVSSLQRKVVTLSSEPETGTVFSTYAAVPRIPSAGPGIYRGGAGPGIYRGGAGPGIYRGSARETVPSPGTVPTSASTPAPETIPTSASTPAGARASASTPAAPEHQRQRQRAPRASASARLPSSEAGLETISEAGPSTPVPDNGGQASEQLDDVNLHFF